MAENEKKTRRRRTEGERAQDTYDSIVGKLEKKNGQREKLGEEISQLDAEIFDLTQTRDFWAGHPAVTPREAAQQDNVGIA